jgi:hypothetical protein
MLPGDPSAAALRAFPLNDDVVEKALLLRKLRRKLSMLAPVMRVTVQYVTLADQSLVDSYMETKRAQLAHPASPIAESDQGRVLRRRRDRKPSAAQQRLQCQAHLREVSRPP